MNSNNSNISINSCYNTNNINTSKYRIKRPFGALQSSYPEFYTPHSKKLKYSPHQTDCNSINIAFNPDSKKNSAVFSSFSNDVEMSSQSQNHIHNTAATDSKFQSNKK